VDELHADLEARVIEGAGLEATDSVQLLGERQVAVLQVVLPAPELREALRLGEARLAVANARLGLLAVVRK